MILSYKKIFIKLAVLFIILDIVGTIKFIKYTKKTKTDEEKYKGELKKILNNYESYISKVEDGFDMKDYQILKVKNFVDLLEIRDTMHIPIIMIENKENLMTCFIIPTNNKILYFYSLGVTQYALPSKHSKEDEDMRENHV